LGNIASGEFFLEGLDSPNQIDFVQEISIFAQPDRGSSEAATTASRLGRGLFSREVIRPFDGIEKI
jgi:hypothetical protein